MGWKLWLDDQIHDPECPERWVPIGYYGAASVAEVCALVETHGFLDLEEMDLDHDLGDHDAKSFLKWLGEQFPDGPVPEWKIHSRNPAGSAWMDSFLQSWKRSLEM